MTRQGSSSPSFLSDAIAKAAIGKDTEVATSFVSAFAPVVHRRRVLVSRVTALPATTNLSLARDMKHDIAIRYSVGGGAGAGAGAAEGAETAMMEVVPPQHSVRALVEIQQQPEAYLPGRALAHASGHYLAAVQELARAVKAERRQATAAAAEEAAAAAAAAVAAEDGASQPRRTPRRKEPRAVFDSAVYTAYVRVEPVHLLMLSNFCYAHDTVAKVWRAPKSASVLSSGCRYGWVAPLFSTFRLTADAVNVRLRAGVEDPGPSTFACNLRDRLSITTVHLPMVPADLDDEAAWSEVATLPEHQAALESAELRRWLHYLAHTSVIDGKVDMPPELRAYPIFCKSAEMAEDLLRSSTFSYSEKEVADFAVQAERDKEEAREQERAAAAQREEALQAAAAQREVALQAAAAQREVALRTAFAKREQAAAETAAALRAELERLKSGSGV